MSAPELFVVRSKAGGNGTSDAAQKFDFEKPGRGFYFEADAVALDIAAGRSQNNLVPWEETLRIMEPSVAKSCVENPKQDVIKARLMTKAE